MGRPTKYTAQTVKRTRKYMAEYAQHGDVIPTVEGLADVLGLHKDTLYAWAKDPEKADFSDALGRMKDLQKRVLLNKGLTGDFNSAIAKLVLSANHAMHERQERDVSGSLDVSGMSDEQLRKRANELLTGNTGA